VPYDGHPDDHSSKAPHAQYGRHNWSSLLPTIIS
jgi:hypothetical protein